MGSGVSRTGELGQEPSCEKPSSPKAIALPEQKDLRIKSGAHCLSFSFFQGIYGLVKYIFNFLFFVLEAERGWEGRATLLAASPCAGQGKPRV